MSSDVKTELRHDDVRVDLHAKTVVITGASTGIGSAIAAEVGRCGGNVVVDYPDERERADAEQVVHDVEAAGGGAAVAVQADVATEAGAAALMTAASRFGGVDVLVNNAGIEQSGAVVDLPLATWERILHVNLTGTFLCSRAAARAMIARGRGGRIINISSVHESLAMPRNAAYAASKGGVRMLMRTLALELADHGITVNDIAPGAIATRINRGVRQDPEQRNELLDEIPLGRIGGADEVAVLCAYLMSEAAGYVTGATFTIDGGLMRFTKGL